jgi:SAM-dependent methyltransferase
MLIHIFLMFAFGKNWDSFSDLIGEERISLAEAGLRRLFPNGELVGKPFLDIGCGSGLSMLAALRLGASEARGVDIDADSAATAARVLARFAPGRIFTVEQRSVFDMSPERDGVFPVVHSWGVLHHTGDMWRAIRTASSLVAPNGLFALALYRQTRFCPAWRVEKRLYAAAPVIAQATIRGLYKGVFFAGLLAKGRNPVSYVANYKSRGMSWSHDIHDWLGGYPYESTSPQAVLPFLKDAGFEAKLIGHDFAPVGLLSTGCSEYVAQRFAL